MSALLVGLVAAKDLVEWDVTETNSIVGAQAVLDRLLEQGLDPEKAPEVKALLEQHNDPFLDCGCPRGFSLFINDAGVASCQRVCFPATSLARRRFPVSLEHVQALNPFPGMHANWVN